MERSYFGLEGKNIIVLGGGLGMGEATSNMLADLGANVAVLDIIAERAERVSADLVKKQVRSIPVVADVLDDDQLVAAIDKTDREFGPLDGMVTIVGQAFMGPAVDAPMEIWDADHRRNLRYIYLASRELAKRLIARGAPGSIACVASVDGIISSTHHAAYGAAKAGLVHLAKSLSGEWAGHRVRFNVVAPGSIATPRIPTQDPEKERAGMGLVPMKWRGSVQDIAKALVFFTSDLASYITGQTLAVDGGYSVTGPIDYERFGAMKFAQLDAVKK
jgi:NAD(P)-dependent dehydrogenase (short-subunit alcohol dehydrogenase family)